MELGSEHGKKCVLRAKIDMKSKNGTMRDPTMYAPTLVRPL
jgi:bifunctional glutamyl/prolyl-tRNA synthetase